MKSLILVTILAFTYPLLAVENILPDPCSANVSMGTWKAVVGEDVCMPVIGIVAAWPGQTAALTGQNLPAGFTFVQSPNDVNIVGFVLPDEDLYDSGVQRLENLPNGAVHGRGYFKGKATVAMDWTMIFVVTSKSGAIHRESKRFIVEDKIPELVSP